MLEKVLQLPQVLPLSVAQDETTEAFSGWEYLFAEQREGYFFLFAPYRPLVVTDPTLAFVDGYYEAYQRLYRGKKQVEALAQNYYPNATAYHGSYKALLSALGLGVCLKNTLLFLAPFGTFFCVEIIDLLGRDAPVQITEHRYDPDCESCGLCERACPTGALAGGDFACERCVRQWQFGMADLADAQARACLGNRVLGCNRCQLACRRNRDVVKKLVEPDTFYREQFDLDQMARVCCAPSFKDSYYASIVGKNYAKPMKLLSFVLSAMLQHDGAAHLPCVRECLAMGNPNAKPLLRQYIELCEAMGAQA